MASGDLALRILMSASVGNTMTSIGQIATALGSGGLAGALVGVSALAIGAAVGFGVAAVKMAGDYDQAMRMVQALTGSNAQQMSYYDAQVKQLAIDAGVAPTELAKGLYNVLSASYSGATAMQVLTLATEDAKIGMTDAATTSNALTNILRTFGVQTKDITRVNGEMLQTVTLGKATFEQYASNITKAASSSKQFGLSLETMNAAWATMTSSGISAGQATTDYTQAVGVMYGNIGTVTKALQKHGIAFNEAKFNAMDFGQKVQYLNGVLQIAADQHVHITGITKQAAQAIKALSDHIGDYRNNLAILSDKQAMADKTQQAWAITQGGFNQSMSRVNASLQVFMITIGNALLPSLTKMATAFAPVITSFAEWVTKSHVVENTIAALGVVFNTIKTIVTPVIGVFMQFMGVLGQVINWVQHNQTAMLAFKYILIGLGAIIAGVLIVALVAVAAIILAVAIVIGVIVGVIMGVIWVVQHWGDLMHWVGGIFSWLGTVAHAVVTAIGGWFSWLGSTVHGILNAIGAAIGVFFSGLGTIVHNGLTAIGNFFVNAWNTIRNGVGNFFSGLGTLVHNGLTAIGQFFVNVFQTIGGWFTWLYNHNYYIKALCDAIKGFFQAAIAWIQSAWQAVVTWLAAAWNWIAGVANIVWNAITTAIKIAITTVGNWIATAWNAVVTWLTNLWNNVKSIATNTWNAVSSAVMSVVNNVTGWLRGVWTTSVTWIGSKWDGMKGLATTAWNNVTAAFSAAWGKISGVLSDLWNNISKWFGDLANNAINWGKNVIQNLINGINSMIDALGKAVGNAAATIAKLLGFHSPTKEGPGSTAHLWAPAFIDMFASGLIAGIPKISNASLQLSNAMNGALGSQFGGSGFAVQGGSFALSGRTTVIVQPGAPSAVIIDKRQLGEIMFNYQAQELRRQGTVKNK